MRFIPIMTFIKEACYYEIQGDAMRIKESSVWELADCRALCECAGILNDFMNADGDSLKMLLWKQPIDWALKLCRVEI